MTEPQVYLNGELIPFSQAKIPIYDKGIVMGATVTEMTRTYRKILFRLEDHLERLDESFASTGIDPGISIKEMAGISLHLVSENAGLLGPDQELGLIHFVTAGKMPLYAGRALSAAENRPTVCIHTFPLDFSFFAMAMKEGYHVITPSIRHIPPQCISPKIKYRSRLHWHLADRESHQKDPHATSLLLDLEGNITECSGANFFLVKNGIVCTPATGNILEGISRKVAMELAQKLQIPLQEQKLKIEDVLQASEAFLSSTPFGLCPATRLNGQPIGRGRPGPVWRRLMDGWSERVGLDAVAQVIQGYRGA